LLIAIWQASHKVSILNRLQDFQFPSFIISWLCGSGFQQTHHVEIQREAVIAPVEDFSVRI
jgi:hypothetical protein